MVTRNMVMPSYAELDYEKARREGVLFIHAEEDEKVEITDRGVIVRGPKREISLSADRVITCEEYLDLFKDRPFLMKFRSEPQLRWSPTKWGRKRYHVGFIRHPRARRWAEREVFGALGEMLIDPEGMRVLPEVNEERCSGCGSCKHSCPHDAINLERIDTPLAVFGPLAPAGTPVARIKEDTCVGCGLCASTCPSDVIVFEASLKDMEPIPQAPECQPLEKR